MHKFLLYPILSCFILFSTQLDAQTVGLFKYENDSQNGYTLFNPFFSTNTYLIDNCGRLIHEWESSFNPAASAVLLENGHLLRTASNGPGTNPVFPFNGGGEKIQEVDWDGNVVQEFTYSDSTHRMHHDFVRLENGNLLIPAWELRTEAEAIQAGRNPALLPDEVLWTEFVIEVNPVSGEIIWEWHMWDHLIQDFDASKDNFGVVADHPELLDINLVGGQSPNGERNWLHVNSIDYNPGLDQIVINSFFLSEFYIIDHSTSTAEAATHSGGNSTQGGDILYRWGNPQNYDHGSPADQTIFGAHHIHWIPEGLNDANKIMYFHNGNGRPDGNYSSVDILDPPISDSNPAQYNYESGVPFEPAVVEWTYVADPPESFYSGFVSGAKRLSNGNTFICDGAIGRFFEINEAKEVVWEYVNPVVNGGVVTQGDPIPTVGGFNGNVVFRAVRYGLSFPGLDGYDLTPGDPIELEFTEPYNCEIVSGVSEFAETSVKISPNPATHFIIIETTALTNAPINIYNAIGQLVATYNLSGSSTQIDIGMLERGLYFLHVEGAATEKIMVEK